MGLGRLFSMTVAAMCETCMTEFGSKKKVIRHFKVFIQPRLNRDEFIALQPQTAILPTGGARGNLMFNEVFKG